MSVHVDKRRGKKIWYVQWRDEHGKRHTRNFGEGQANERLAKAYDHELKAAKKRKVSTIPGQRASVKFDEVAQAYITHCRASNRSERWIKGLIHMLNNFWLEKLCTKPVDEMTYQDDILPFIETYRNHSQATRNRYLGYLKAMFNFGIKHGMTQNNPLKTWQKAKELPRAMALTVEDLGKIHEHAQEHLKWAIEIVWNTGIRPGPKELFSMKWSEHVDFERGIVRVLGKGNLYREVPMSDPFKKRMLEMKEKATCDYVVEYQGGPIKKIRRSLPTAAKKAGIEYPVCMYSIRHLFATVALSRGGDLHAVSKILGHSSTQMTVNQYYHLLDGEKVRVVGLIPQIGEV